MLLILAGLILVAAPEGGAGLIRLQSDTRFDVTNGLPVAIITIVNCGEEPTRVTHLGVGLADPDAPISGKTLSHAVAPGESIQEPVPLSLPPSASGIHQVVTRIRYADYTGGEFSSVSVSEFCPAGAEPSGGHEWVVPSVAPVVLGRSAVVRVSLLLIQDDPAGVTVRLVLPDELECRAPVQKVLLEPDSTRELTFEVAAGKAIPGGVYPLYAIVEQETAGPRRSASAAGVVTVADTRWLGESRWVWLAVVGVIAGLLVLLGRRRPVSSQTSVWLEAGILALLTGFILWQFSPFDLVSQTTTVGGDTPAHLYLASHLQEQLFRHGRIISWAGGWWGGFPLFQFYFVLPYLAAALLGGLIPLSIAFKLVSVAGVVMTPLCAYWAGRLWRLPRPIPIVLAIAMLPFLFVQSHTMWGVNTASTLAGMIANSWSFALMLPALASGCRDAEAGRCRLGTVVLMVLVLSSHFFTSVMMFLSLAVVPLLCPAKDRLRAARVLFLEGLLALLLMSWWLVPLVAKSAYSMDFGTNWEVSLWKTLPAYAAALLVLAVVALVPGWRQGMGVSPAGALVGYPLAIGVLLWMLLAGMVLFRFGFFLSPVFVNVRLWPFIFFAWVALAAVGMGRLLQPLRGLQAWLVVLTAAVLLGVMAGDSPSGRLSGRGMTRMWATWNYSGLEAKPAAPVFERLVMPLRGTPGRLANDLCEENNQLGSSRVFELAPYLAGKPVLEGGLVNSALGSMYAYTIQGEASDSCAGFPPIVTPQPFNIAVATRHMELFNVKHFIARSERTKQALRQQPGWRFVAREQDWELYELMTHEGRFVTIPPRMPLLVRTARWKECSLDWLTTPQALDQLVIWMEPGVGPGGMQCLPEKRFLDLLAGWRQGATNGLGAALQEAGTRCISDEEVTDDRISFKTIAVGSPHLIKVSWFPNWKVRGAKGVYRVSPGFMLVYPEQETVELYYGLTLSDGVGYALTVLGLLGVVLAARQRARLVT